MKFLVLLLVILFAVWLFRSRQQGRSAAVSPPPPSSPAGTQHQAVRACLYCGVHAIETEMVSGRRGLYCCAEHLQQAGDGVARG